MSLLGNYYFHTFSLKINKKVLLHQLGFLCSVTQWMSDISDVVVNCKWSLILIEPDNLTFLYKNAAVTLC